MAKQIYNYELFTNKKDELAKIRKKAARNRRIKILLLALILAGTAIVAYILFNSKCNYYTYKDKVDTEDSGDVSYENFDEGYLKYSSNGIEYQKQFGRAEWNIALSYEHPFLAKSDSYAVLGDKGENTLILLNKLEVDCGHALIYRGKRLSDYSSDFSEWNTACGKLLFYQWKYFQNIYCILRSQQTAPIG